MKHKYLFFLLLMVGGFELLAQGIIEKNGIKYQDATIILKIKNANDKIDPQGRMSTNTKASSFLRTLGVKKARQLFQDKTLARSSQRKNTAAASKFNISNIYKIEVSSKQDLRQTIKSLEEQDWVEYAELAYSHDVLGTMGNLLLADDTIVCVNDSIIIDDTYANQQFGHTNSQVYEAWCLEKGDTNVVVGVIDTGCRTSHPEFVGQLQYNWLEKNGTPGVDDDMNGFVDDTLGYDVAEWDNDVSDDPSTNTHGTEVASIIASKVGNDFGTIGVGYNTRVLPVKISNDSYLRNEYEGIMYAVENGARIVNLSWGRNGFPSQYEQDIINYITEVYDVMVVAAAGNTNAELNFYPASYQNVLSAAHNSADESRFSGSTYSYFVDMQAAGNRPVASTGYTNGFDQGHQNVVGSSYASPFVAGIGALVANHYPDLKATQIAELLRVTADDKYHIAGNTGFEEKLGKGQVNAYRALTERNQQIAVRMTNFDYNGDFGRDLVADDTIEIFCDFTNFLEPTSSNLNITLTTLSSSATVLTENQTFNAGAMSTLEEKDNNSTPFKLHLHSDIAEGHEIYLRLGYSDGDYTDYQYFIITYRFGAFNIGFFNNNIALGVGSNGRLGHIGVSQGDDGMGLTYKSVQFLEEAGLIVSTNSSTVSDAVLSTSGNKEDDFAQISQTLIHFWEDTAFSAQSKFEDYSKNNGSPIGLEFTHTVTWQNNTDHQDYVAIEYDVKNVSGASIDSVHVALFADWDMPNAEDFADWDTTNAFGYVYNDQSNYVGIKVHNPNKSYFAFDMTNVGGDNINVTDDFSTSEKNQAVSNKISRTKAGYSLSGSNVAHSVGTTVYNLQNDSTYKVHFIIMAGSSLADLQKSDSSALVMYKDYLDQGDKPMFGDSTFCVGSPFTIAPTNGFAFNFYDSPEMDTVLYSGPSFMINNPDTTTTYYVTNIDKTLESEPATIRLRASKLDASFEMVSSLNIYDSAFVHFTDRSTDAVSWSWNFGDGAGTSTMHNPIYEYADTGTFDVTLTVMDTLGCSIDTTKQITIFYNQTLPALNDTTICINSTMLLTPDEGNLFKFYDALPLTTPIYEGETLVIEDLDKDTLIYFTGEIPNTDGSYEDIQISVSDPTASFTSADTYNLSDSAAISFTDASTGAVSWAWDFGDDTGTSTLQNPEYGYTAQGEYYVTLIITDQYGCTSETGKEITVVARSPEPVVSNATVCINSDLTIKPSNGSIFNFYESADATDTLATGDSYTLSAIAVSQSVFISNIDSAIESSRVEMQITVSDPTALFTSADTYNLSDSAAVSFTDASTGAVSWAWGFGDGTGTSTIQNPEYGYDAQGEYTVTLVITDVNGCTSETEKEITVVARSPEPVVSNTTICIDSDLEINPEGGSLFNFYESNDAADPLATGDSYTLSSVSASQSIFISNIDSAIESSRVEMQITVSDPTASFTSADTYNLSDSSAINFTDASTGAVSWAWDFGDGTGTSTMQNPEYGYDAQGEYYVTIVITDQYGCTSETEKEITVVARSPEPIVSNTIICIDSDLEINPEGGSLFNFYESNEAADPLVTGDSYTLSSVSTSQSIFISNIDSAIESSRVEMQITVSDPTASFTSADTYNLSDSSAINFTDASTGAVSWVWDFGDGTGTSTMQNPEYGYDAQGEYYVTLVITDQYGCISETGKEITVVARSPEPAVSNTIICIDSDLEINPTGGSLFNFYESNDAVDPLATGDSYTLSSVSASQSIFISTIDSAIESSRVEMQITVSDPTASFTSADTYNLSDSSAISFTDASTGAVSWAWDFGDGVGTSTMQNPEYGYDAQGEYYVTLVITDQYGCTSETGKEITVIARSPEPVVSNTTICINSDLEINPEGGALFNFYESNEAADPLATGDSYNLSSVSASQSIFISNIDSAIESSRVEMQITVSDPIAGFISDDIFNVSDSSAMKFYDNSSTDAMMWAWDFGDGIGTSIDANPEYSYQYQGDYLVKLTITNELGCTDYFEKAITVISQSPMPSLEDEVVCIGGNVEIFPGNGTLFNFYESLEAENPIATGNSYVLASIIENQSLFVSNIDSVIESSRAEMQISISDPVAHFNSAGIFNLSDSSSIKFTDDSPDAVIWSWDFGDEIGASSEPNPEYSYTSQGEYLVTLSITNDLGCIDVFEKEILVVAVGAMPEIEDKSICKGDNIEVKPSNGSLFNFYNTIDADTPIATGSSYTMTNILESQTLYISNIDSLVESDRAAMQITVSVPTASFTSDDVLNLNESTAMQFTDNSTDAISWSWDFGDGSGSSSEQNPQYAYHGEGTFEVVLTIANQIGCTDQFSKTVTVINKSNTPVQDDIVACLELPYDVIPSEGNTFNFYEDENLETLLGTGGSYNIPSVTASDTLFITSIDSVLESDPIMVKIKGSKPVADFSANMDSLNVLATNEVIFTAAAGKSWLWDFDNGQLSNAQSATAFFTEEGEYQVTLVVTDSVGCDNTSTQVFKVYSDAVTGIENKLLTEQVEIFPNPAHEVFSIKVPLKNEVKSIQLIDITGKENLNFDSIYENNGIYNIDISRFPNGIFYLKMSIDNSVIIKKIVKR